ncbi:MAG: hypothetical protein A2X94_14785 [Bdellovibrionales bacterium GWB1_55_8]|nr:MAG: hypothetical protein A2X94_14785 [Bdellovibrionales bacterium GWB1_55_8]
MKWRHQIDDDSKNGPLQKKAGPIDSRKPGKKFSSKVTLNRDNGQTEPGQITPLEKKSLQFRGFSTKNRGHTLCYREFIRFFPYLGDNKCTDD